MADLSQAERDRLSPDDFGDAAKRLFPITDQASVESAAHLLGKADDPAAVRAKVIAIAKRKGLTLPDAWQDADRDGIPDAEDPKDRADVAAETRSTTVPDQQAQTIDTPAPSPFYVIPITRIDREQRVVEGVATSEALDTFGTVFDYEASKKAFGDWAGNVREMHDRKAVGRRFEIRFDDAKRQVVVQTRISKGAQDTWEKVLDGTLSGYSIGASDCTWEKRAVRGQQVPVCVAYRLAELSLVDAASNPDARSAGLAILRADAADEQTAIFDDLDIERPKTEPRTDQATEAREGKTISKATQDKLHGVRDASLAAARSAMDACGCDDCQAMGAKGDDESPDRALLAVVTRVIDQTLGPLRREVALLRSTHAVQTPDATRCDNDIDPWKGTEMRRISNARLARRPSQG